MKFKNVFLLLILLAGVLTTAAFISFASNDEFKARAEISSGEFLDNIRILASDEMKGRGNGTPEMERAAALIRDNFRSAGLEPLGEDYYQQFEIQTGNEFGPGYAVLRVACSVASGEGTYTRLGSTDMTTCNPYPQKEAY